MEGERFKEYLGDGVYAEYDGYHVVLTTDGNKIYLDQQVMAALGQYNVNLPKRIAAEVPNAD